MIIFEMIDEPNMVEEYFKIMLGGLFGIATIVVAIMSISANIINEKCLNMYVNKMFRFNILFTFSPIYILILYCFLIMKWSWLATDMCAIIIAILIYISITTYCSYLTAQYVIDTKRFQKKVMNVSIKNLRKEIKNKDNKNSIIIKYMNEAYKNINNKDCRIFIDKKSREELYNNYLNEIDVKTIADDELKDVIDILIAEFEMDKAFELCSDFRVGQLTYMFLSYFSKESNEDYIKKCIRKIHSYIVYNEWIDDEGREYFKEIILFNQRALTIPDYFLLTLEFIIDSNFVIKDAKYLSIIIRQIFRLSKIFDLNELNLDENKKSFLDKLLKAEENFEWNDNENEKDEAIRTALIMLGGEKNEK